MCLFTGGPEVSVEHDASSRTCGIDRRSIVPRKIETLDDNVVCGTQQDHPVRDWRCAVDHYVAGIPHCFEVDIVTIAGGWLLLKHEARIGARHHCNKIAAERGV